MNNGANASSNPSSYTIESNNITLATPTYSGYTFGGWYSEESFTEGNEVSTIATGSYGNLSLYAKWTAISYSITYSNCESATNSNPTSYTIESSTITLTVQHVLVTHSEAGIMTLTLKQQLQLQ